MTVYIYDAVRTPRGAGKKDKGALGSVAPLDLVAQLLHALPQRNDFDAAQVEDLVLGCVTQVGAQGANIARIAALHAGWPDTVPGITVNRFCTSGLDACAIAAARIAAGESELLLAGGVESMSQVAMFSDKGAWYSDPAVMRSTRFTPLGISADLLATLEGFDRETLDRLALESHRRALAARENAVFAESLVPVTGADGSVVLAQDEPPRAGLTLEKLNALPAAFEEMGKQGFDQAVLKAYPQVASVSHVHSPGNSPAPADGASLLLIGNEQCADRHGLAPKARIVASASAAADPVLMLTAAEDATRKVLARSGLSLDDIDRFEVNEAFAATTLRYQRVFELDDTRVNVNGGAIALGHAMGATGGMLIAQVLDELKRSGGRYGLVAVAGGGGLGSAMIVERAA